MGSAEVGGVFALDKVSEGANLSVDMGEDVSKDLSTELGLPATL